MALYKSVYYYYYLLLYFVKYINLNTNNELYDLHINSMTYMLFFKFQIICFKKYLYVSLGNNFFTVFLWRPFSCGCPWATAQFAPL